MTSVVDTLKPFHAAAFACDMLQRMGVSIQCAEVTPGGKPLVRCDYTRTLTRRFPKAETCGRDAEKTHYRAEFHGVELAWDEPSSVWRRDTLRRALQRGAKP